MVRTTVIYYSRIPLLSPADNYYACKGEALLIQAESKELRRDGYVRIAAFWVLLLLCVSPLVATLNMLIGVSTDPFYLFALLDAYRFHLSMNAGLGMIAVVVIVVWVIDRFRVLGVDSVFKELLGQKWALPLLLMVALISISTLLNCSSLEAAFMGDEDRLEGILSMLCYVGFALCALIINDPCRKRALLLTFWTVSIAIGVLYLIQIADISMLGYLNSTTFCVIFGQMNHHGYYLGMGILASAGLFVYEKHPAMRVAAALTVVLLTACLIINTSLGSFVAAAFALAFLAVIALVRDGRAKLLALVPLALFLVVSLGNVAGLNYRAGVASLGAVVTGQEQAAPQEGSSSGSSSTTGANVSSLFADMGKIASGAEDVGTAGTGRMALWMGSMQLIGQSPVVGYGMEHGGPLLYDLVGTDSDRAHNEVLQWGLYGGVPAMLLYVAGLAMLAVRQLRRLRQLDPLTVIAIACCAEYLCSSLFGVVMITTAPYFWMFVGFAAALPSAKEGATGEREAESDVLPTAGEAVCERREAESDAPVAQLAPQPSEA